MVVVGRPSLWGFGALGFALRGGLVLLLASMVAFPTPIELRLLLGTNLGSAGLTPGFIALLAVAAVAAVALLLAALAIIAHVELAAFERLVRDPETTDQRSGRPARVPSGGERGLLLAGLFLVQLVALGALIVTALPLIGGVISAAYDELVRPSVGGSFYARVLAGVREPLFVLLAGLVLIELISSLATRRLLVRAFGLSAAPPPRGVMGMLLSVPAVIIGAMIRPLRRPVSTLATLVAVWAVSLAALVPLSWVIAAGWQSLRSAYLGPLTSGDADAMIGAAVVTLVLAAIWTMAVLLGGFVSALRAARWSVDGLR
jgi:hypothetical protein